MNPFFLSCKECVLQGPRNFYGCFYLGPFNSSQSLTIANALRRTLLSEISGLKIISVEIEGISHEYSTILGVRESVLDILLNLKEISFCYTNIDTISKVFVGHLQICGPGVIRASDLKLPIGIACVDSDQYIATLSITGQLNMKFIVCESNSMNSKNTIDMKASAYLTFSSNEKFKFFLLNSKMLNSNNNQKFITRNNFCSKNKHSITRVIKKFNNHLIVRTINSFNLKVKQREKVQKIVQKKNLLQLHSMTGIEAKNKSLVLDNMNSPIQKVNYLIEPYGSPTGIPSASGGSGGSIYREKGTWGAVPPRAPHPGAREPVETNSFWTYQVIFLELWTDGSIHPRTALYKALNILNSTFSKLEKMKCLNDIYLKSMFTSDSFSKLMKKTLYNLNISRKKFLKNSANNSNKNSYKNGYRSKTLYQVIENNSLFLTSLKNKRFYWSGSGVASPGGAPPNGGSIYREKGTWGAVPPRAPLAKPSGASYSNFKDINKISLFSQKFNKITPAYLSFNSINRALYNHTSLVEKFKLNDLDKNQEKLLLEMKAIKILQLPFRIENCLIQANILTINDLVNKINHLLEIPGFGEETVYFIKQKLFLFFTKNNYI